MQTLHSQRARLRHQLGFTLIELMVTVAVLAIIGAAAFAGFRQNEFRNQYKRFVDDCTGVLVTARNYAIDEQTIVQVTIQDDLIEARAWENDTNAWDLIGVVALDNADALLAGGNGCIHGLVSGVQTPNQAIAIVAPASCSGAPQVLQFEPDGTFTDPNDSFTSLDNAGATLWLGNHQLSGEVKYSHIQIFPGGLIRSFLDTKID